MLINHKHMTAGDNEMSARTLRPDIKVLVFSLNDEEYAVDIKDTREVLDLYDLTKIPYAPDFVKGAMNLRGEIITVIDIRTFFGLNRIKRMEESKVIVTDVTGAPVGILCDYVKGTEDIDPASIQPVLLTDDKNQGHVKGQALLGERILVLLDLDGILRDPSIIQLWEG